MEKKTKEEKRCGGAVRCSRLRATWLRGLLFPPGSFFSFAHPIPLFFLFSVTCSDWATPGSAPAADDGPAGMTPEGLIESNWDQVRGPLGVA